MRTILTIAVLDLRRFFVDRTSYIWLFLMPLAFVYFTGIPNQTGPGEPEDPRPALYVDDQDEGFLGKRVAEALEAQGFWKVESEDQAPRGVRIPPNFSENALEGAPVPIVYFKTDSEDEQSDLMELRLFRALAALNGALVEWALNARPGEVLDATALDAILAKPDQVTLESQYAGRTPIPTGYQQSLPGNLVTFLLMNTIIFGASSMLEERRCGALKRLAAYPLNRWQLLFGKLVGRWALGLTMVVFFMLVGRFLFGVDTLTQGPAVFAILAIFTWVAASIGILMGSIFSSEDKATGLSVMCTLMMAALGGCWWPIEIVPESMRAFGHLFPTAWAMDALTSLTSFGGTLASVAIPAAVLAGYGLVANIIAARFLRLE